MRNKHLLTILILAVAVVLTGCDRKRIYSHYEHVPQGGWDKTDTLFFEVPPVKEAGTYQEEIGIRTDLDYPFQSFLRETSFRPSRTAHSMMSRVRSAAMASAVSRM